MASAATLQIENLGTKTLQKGQVSKDILAVAKADYLTLLRGIAAQDTAAQIRIGNSPTNIIVDNRPGKPIDEAVFSVQVFFVDAALIRRALIEAWREVQMASRRVTGATADRYEVWAGGRGGDRVLGSSPASVQLSAIKPGVGLMIVGPMVAHTRKYRFFDRSGNRMMRKTRAKKYANRVAAGQSIMVRQSLQELVVAKLKRQFRALNISEVWVDVPDLNPAGKSSVNKVPAIYIGSKRRGRI